MPTVSIIMNCLNCEKYLKEAIDSVYAQTYTDWEIIFWDNASTDRSAEIAKSYDEKLRYFRSNETVPLGKARNWAIEKACGKYIAFLDCDDMWLPEKLEKQIPLFERNSRVGLVYSNTIFYNQKTGKERVIYKKKQPRGNIFRVLLKSYFLSMEAVVIRRKTLDGLKEWFDPRFNMIEEADLFTRIAHDWEAEYVHEPLAKWRIHDKSWTWKKMGLFGKESRLMIDKYKRLYPDFEMKYKKEIKKREAKAAYREALEAWKKGNRSKVRKIILPHIVSNSKLFGVFLLSLLPYEKYAKLLRSLVRHP